MKRKIKFFRNEHTYDLEKEVNAFAESNNVESVSYSTCESGYTTYHYCCVMYLVN